jgi:hypothetical protein
MSIWLDGRFIFYRIDRTSNERPEMETLGDWVKIVPHEIGGKSGWV